MAGLLNFLGGAGEYAADVSKKYIDSDIQNKRLELIQQFSKEQADTNYARQVAMQGMNQNFQSQKADDAYKRQVEMGDTAYERQVAMQGMKDQSAAERQRQALINQMSLLNKRRGTGSPQGGISDKDYIKLFNDINKMDVPEQDRLERIKQLDIAAGRIQPQTTGAGDPILEYLRNNANPLPAGTGEARAAPEVPKPTQKPSSPYGLLTQPPVKTFMNNQPMMYMLEKMVNGNNR